MSFVLKYFKADNEYLPTSAPVEPSEKTQLAEVDLQVGVDSHIPPIYSWPRRTINNATTSVCQLVANVMKAIQIDPANAFGYFYLTVLILICTLSIVAYFSGPAIAREKRIAFGIKQLDDIAHAGMAAIKSVALAYSGKQMDDVLAQLAQVTERLNQLEELLGLGNTTTIAN